MVQALARRCVQSDRLHCKQLSAPRCLEPTPAKTLGWNSLNPTRRCGSETADERSTPSDLTGVPLVNPTAHMRLYAWERCRCDSLLG